MATLDAGVRIPACSKIAGRDKLDRIGGGRRTARAPGLVDHRAVGVRHAWCGHRPTRTGHPPGPAWLRRGSACAGRTAMTGLIELSAGVIPYRVGGDRSLTYLVLHSATVRNPRAKWEFPKGGIEAEETPREAAALRVRRGDQPCRVRLPRGVRAEPPIHLHSSRAEGSQDRHVLSGRGARRLDPHLLVRARRGRIRPLASLGHVRPDQPTPVPCQDSPALRRGRRLAPRVR